MLLFIPFGHFVFLFFLKLNIPHFFFCFATFFFSLKLKSSTTWAKIRTSQSNNNHFNFHWRHFGNGNHVGWCHQSRTKAIARRWYSKGKFFEAVCYKFCYRFCYNCVWCQSILLWIELIALPTKFNWSLSNFGFSVFSFLLMISIALLL